MLVAGIHRMHLPALQSLVHDVLTLYILSEKTGSGGNSFFWLRADAVRKANGARRKAD